ncbi:hypothetical protein R3F72_08095, partial [Salinicola sp. 4072]
VDRLSPIADGSLGSDSWRNTLNFQENTIRYLRFRAGLMNKPGSGLRTNPAKDICIENGVWVAEDVYIYKGATIGAGTIVGARATVTGKLPANSLCLGTPAKAVRSGVTWQDEPLATFKKDKSECQELA